MLRVRNRLFTLLWRLAAISRVIDTTIYTAAQREREEEDELLERNARHRQKGRQRQRQQAAGEERNGKREKRMCVSVVRAYVRCGAAGRWMGCDCVRE